MNIVIPWSVFIVTALIRWLLVCNFNFHGINSILHSLGFVRVLAHGGIRDFQTHLIAYVVIWCHALIIHILTILELTSSRRYQIRKTELCVTGLLFLARHLWAILFLQSQLRIALRTHHLSLHFNCLLCLRLQMSKLTSILSIGLIVRCVLIRRGLIDVVLLIGLLLVPLALTIVLTASPLAQVYFLWELSV